MTDTAQIKAQIEQTEKAQTAATQHEALPLGELVLLGTYIRAEGSQALLRQRNGRMSKVSLGDRIARREVAAITDGQVVLSRNGQAQTLTMPAG